MSDETKPADPKPVAETFPSEVDALLREIGLRNDQSTVDQGKSTRDPNHTTGQEPDSPAPATGAVAIAGYEILGELGRGGMGVVFKARHAKLNRTVALKMILGPRADSKEVFRFLAEAEAVAAIKHPNVVQVHDYGEAGGRPYMALEYLPGGPLANLLEGERLDPEAAAAVIGQVARGVAAAHALGIVHRDLKPANVLLDETGEPKVTDFGLAKRGTGSDLTATQTVMGTPSYMSPEQAKGDTKFVGPQADVWALGVILYEALAGKRPFDAAGIQEVLSRILTTEPEPPRKLVPSVPRDLELICLKCLEKEPHERYPTAKELADDLGRFVDGRSISVRPAGPVERVVKWTRRKPTLAAAYGLAFISLALGGVVVGAVNLWQRAEGARDRAETAQGLAETERQRADTERGNAVGARDIADQLRGAAEEAFKTEQAAKLALGEAKDRLARIEYARTVELAYREYLDNNIVLARQYLASCPAELRGWEWRYVHRLCHAEEYIVETRAMTLSCAFSRDGRVLAVPILPTPEAIKAGKADLTKAELRIYDTATGKKLGGLTCPHPSFLSDYTVSSDGTMVALADGKTEVTVLDVATGNAIATLKGHQKRVTSVAFSPANDRIATGAEDGSARLWDAKTGKIVSTHRGHQLDRAVRVSVGPDGKRVASVGEVADAHVWDATTGQLQFSFPGYSAITRPFWCGPDGNAVVLIGTGSGAVYDLEKKAFRRTFGSTAGVLLGAGISRDGKAVVTAGRDGVVRVWDVATGRQIATFRGHESDVLGVAFVPDGSRVVSFGREGSIRAWNPNRPSASQVSPDTTTGRLLAVSGDGKRAAVGDDKKGVTIYSTETGAKVCALLGHTEAVWQVAFAPDGSRVITGGLDRTVRVWDAKTGGQQLRIDGAEGTGYFALSPDGRHVVSGGRVPPRVWSIEKGTVVATSPKASWGGELAFTGDGKGVWFVAPGGDFILWDWMTGGTTVGWQAGQDLPAPSALSPDGSRIVFPTDYLRATLQIADTKTGAVLGVLRGHARSVREISFNADCTRIVTSSDDGTMRLWDAHTGASLMVVPKAGFGGVARFDATGNELICFPHDDGRFAILKGAEQGAPPAPAPRPKP